MEEPCSLWLGRPVNKPATVRRSSGMAQQRDKDSLDDQLLGGN